MWKRLEYAKGKLRKNESFTKDMLEQWDKGDKAMTKEEWRTKKRASKATQLDIEAAKGRY